VLGPDFSGSSFALRKDKDLVMMVACESEGREKTEAEYQSLLNETGFKISEVIRLDAPHDLIIARKK